MSEIFGRKMGLAISGKHMGYGWGWGFGLWMPLWLKDAIVTVWNFFACLIYGHEMFGPVWAADGALIAEKKCVACCKRFPSVPGEGFVEVDDDRDDDGREVSDEDDTEES